MKFYMAAGLLAPTQAAAKERDRNFVDHEVPTDKEGLMGYVNGLLAQIAELRHGQSIEQTFGGHTAAETPTVENAPEPAVSVPPPPPSAPVQLPAPANGAPKKTLEEVIQDMPAAKLAPLAESVVCRFGELGEEAFEALEQHQGEQGVGGAFSRGVHLLSCIASGPHQLTRLMFRARKEKKWA